MEELRTPDLHATEAEPSEQAPEILEEIAIEELAIDGICGVY